VSAPTLAQLVRYFLVLGATGFGGPVALASAMRRDLVERRGWLDEAAAETGRSKGALKVNLHRALKALRGRLGGEPGPDV